MLYYVYLITNLVLNKQYVGSRMCYKDKIEDDIYWGSSKYLNEDYEIYGKTNFTKEILKDDYTNKNNMLDGETEYILKYNTLEPNGYNRFLPNQHLGFHGSYNHTKEHNKKISNAFKGIAKSQEHIQHIVESKLREKNPMFGKSISEKTRQAIVKSNMCHIGEKGRMFGKTHSDEQKEKWKKERKGLAKTKEHKQHISESHKGKIYITNGIITKQLKRDQPIPNGWKLGRRKLIRTL